MTIGPDNPGNGAAKTEDRFAGQLGYRPRGNRDNPALPASPLNGSALGSSALDGGDDFGPRNGNAGIERMTGPLDIANPIASTLTQPKLGDGEPPRTESTFREPAYREPEPWLDGPGQAVVDHPLLRGLLLELPPKGAQLQAQWLDRWFEAARSILELLYRFEDSRD